MKSIVKMVRTKKKRHSTKSLFDDAVLDKCYNMALLGLTDVEIANCLLIKKTTLELWKRKHPGLVEVLNKGKAIADARVARALFERAVGYSHPEEKVFVSKGEVIKVDTTKHYAPDTAAICFWLKNRTRNSEQPWIDALKHELSGKDGGPIDINKIETIDTENFTDEELKILLDISPKLFGKLNKKPEEEC